MDQKCRFKMCMFITILLIISVLVFLYFLIVSFIQDDLISQLPIIFILVGLIVFLGKLLEKICGCDKEDKSNKQDQDIDYDRFKKEQRKNDEEQERSENKHLIERTPPKREITPQQKKKVSTILLPILIICGLLFALYQAGFFPFLGSTNPVGRWKYEMAENTVINGVENLTDYWYMDFYEDGTVIMGIKNVGYPEDPEGSGSWYLEDNVIHVSLSYDWGGGSEVNYVIRMNQLIEYETNIGSGYYRD